MTARTRTRLALVATVMLLISTATTRVADAAPAPTPPLATKGSRIVDATGRTVVLQGVNWFGFETANHVVHGLWSRDLDEVMGQIRGLGFNTVRIPFSLQALRSDAITGVDFSNGRNAQLRGRTPLQALDAVVTAAEDHHLMVLLDFHSLQDDGYQWGLWYGQGGYSETDWVTAWRMLAKRYATRSNVIGADLKNEPHGPATWGGGGPADWHRAAERAGNAILGVAPHWLIVVGGVEGPIPGQRLERHWWGGNLEGVARNPVRLARPNRVVYSPHEYGPGVFNQPWFQGGAVPAVLTRRWQVGFNYITERGIAPVLIGEFGGRQVGLGSVEGRWQRQFLDFISREGLSWTYWALNPNSGDTGGILRDDWTTVDPAKIALLRRTMRRQRIPFRASGAAPRSPSPRPASARPTPAPVARPVAPATPSRPTTLAPLRATAVVDSRWEQGFCAHVEVSGPPRTSLAGAAVRLSLPAGTTIVQTWNAEASATSGALRLTLPAWAAVGDGTPYRDTGFCASGTGEPSSVSVS